MLTFKSTGKPAKIYYTTPDTKYMPAKMMYGENMATGYDMITETGETVTLLGDYNKGLVSLQINGKSTQDGTPTPDNPVEVESVGDLTTKNLLPNDWEAGFISTSSGNNQGGSTYVRTKDYFTFDISKNYYISSDSIDTSATISWYFYDENKNFMRRFVTYKDRTIGTSGCQVTIPTNAVFFRLVVLTTDINIKVQIEEGSTATEYEPYHKYKVPVVTKGKNLFDISKVITGGKVTNNGNGSLTVSGGATSAGGVATLQSYCPDLKVGDVVTLNAVATADAEIPVGFRRIYIYGIKMAWAFGTSKRITQDMLTGGRVAWYYAGYNESGEPIPTTISNIQIEYGTTATEYEPYIPPVTTNIYLDEPLRGIESYKDYIEVRNGAVKKYQNIGTATENVTDAKPNSEYLGTMTLDGTADESGSITVQDGETVYYILSTPIVTDITDTETGQELLSINTEYGKTKTLTVTGTDMTVEQCKLNTQDS